MLRPMVAATGRAATWGAAILAAATGTTRILRVAAARGPQSLRHHLPTGTRCGKGALALAARPRRPHRMLHQWPRSSAALPRPPHAPRHWHSNGFAFGICAAVLQCAPRARTNGSQMLRARQSASKDVPATGADRERPSALHKPFPHQWLEKASHKAKRFQKHFGPAKGLAKGPANRQKLFSTFFQNPLARSPEM